ncbi:MAG: SDR family oxidoreductase [Acidobacteria bacterium]|nr:SDR family oxidoreductase [Acidobacteriota bacterium]
MRILITGGAGFIGSHMTDRLMSEGHQVVAMDNLVTGGIANIEHHRSNPNFEFIHHDVSNHIHVQGRLDWVLNFASPASPIDYLQLPIQTLKVGAMGTHNALGLAKAKCANFLLTSTSEVYGDPLVHPQHEDYWGNVNPIGPRGVYDEAKRYAEALSMAYHRTHGIDVRIVRIFNTYGPRNRVNDGRVVPTFINQALRNEPLTVFGEGNQTRSFQYVDDLIDGIRRLMDVPFNKPVNIGNPNEMTILQFAELIIRLTGSSSPIEFRPLPEDDPKTRKPDITRAKSVLGWEPRVPVQEGLEKTIDWYRRVQAHDRGNS